MKGIVLYLQKNTSREFLTFYSQFKKSYYDIRINIFFNNSVLEVWWQKIKMSRERK